MTLLAIIALILAALALVLLVAIGMALEGVANDVRRVAVAIEVRNAASSEDQP